MREFGTQTTLRGQPLVLALVPLGASISAERYGQYQHRPRLTYRQGFRVAKSAHVLLFVVFQKQNGIDRGTAETVVLTFSDERLSLRSFLSGMGFKIVGSDLDSSWVISRATPRGI